MPIFWIVAALRRQLRPVRLAAAQADDADEALRRAVPGSARPAVAGDSRRPRVPDRDGHGGRRAAGAGRASSSRRRSSSRTSACRCATCSTRWRSACRFSTCKFFVTAVTIQRETGGNLAEILDNLAHVVRERFKILRQVRVHTAHGRFTGYVLLALPAALAVALTFINPEHMKLLFDGAHGPDDDRRGDRDAGDRLRLDPQGHQDRGVACDCCCRSSRSSSSRCWSRGARWRWRRPAAASISAPRRAARHRRRRRRRAAHRTARA